MRTKCLLLCVGTVLFAAAAVLPVAGQTPKRTMEQMKADYEAHKGDFDYLLGDWEFSARNKVRGAFHGYWSAVRLADNAQILDAYRIVNDKGETVYSTNTLRNYNAVLDQWELISVENGVGLHDFGTGHKEGGEMHIEQRFDVMNPKPTLWHIRYYNIRPDRFSWSADRSLDDGKTWDKDFMVLEARRIGPARSVSVIPDRPKVTGGGTSR